MLNRLQSEYVDQDAATEDELRQIVSGAPAPAPAPTTFTSNTFTPTPTTYTAPSAQTLAPTPEKIALFGDSISSAVGYGADSNIDTKYGNTVADVLSGYFGTSVDSQAIGGLTTQDVLSGKALPGGKSYEDYLKEQKPSFAILRYGAADAIKLNDPAKTIANLQSMIDLAKQYGSQPVLVGVSPFASGNDIRAGNINEWSVDPYINSAEIINAGIKQLAEKNNLQFVDVRSLDAPKGSLLDGVHPTADFGKQMADYIGQSVASAFPQFSNVSLTPTPKTTGLPGTGGIGGDASSLPATTPKPFDVTKADWSQGVQNIGGTIYQPQFDSVQLGHGEEGGMWGRGALQNVLRYKEGQTAPGQTYEILDPTTGKVIGSGQFKEQSHGFFGDLFGMTQQAAADLGPILQFVPGIGQAVQAVNAVSAIESGNVAQGIASLAGAGQGIGLGDFSTIRNIASIAAAIENKDPLAALSAGMNLTGTKEIGGFTTRDITAANAVVQGLQSGNVAQALTGASQLTNSPNTAVAAAAVNFYDAARKGNPAALLRAGEMLTGAINNAQNQAAINQAYQDPTRALDTVLGGDIRGGGLTTTVGAEDLTPEDLAAIVNPPGQVATTTAPTGSAATSTAAPSTQTGAAATTIDTSRLPAFNRASITTLPQSRAAEIIAEMYPGQSLDWVNQAVLNAAASHIRADDEAGLRARLAAGQPLGTGDAISGDRAVDYRAPAGTRVAQPGENAGLLGYTETGTPVNLIQQLGTTAKKMTPEEAFAYDMANAGEAIDPLTGRPYELDTSANAQAIADVIRGPVSSVASGIGEQAKLLGVAGGWLTGDRDNALKQWGSNVESWANSITPDSIKKGQDQISKGILEAEGLPAKAWAAVTGAATNPLATLHWIGKEAIQEFLPLGSAITVGRTVSNAAKLKYGEDLAKRFGLTAAIGTDSTINAGESATASYEEVYNNLLNKGVPVDKASSAAAAAAAGSGLVTLFTAAIGDAALVNKLMNNIKGATLNATLREGPTEFAEGALQSVAEQNATNLALGKGLIFDPNEALTSGTLEWLIGTGTTGTIAKGADIFTPTVADTQTTTKPATPITSVASTQGGDKSAVDATTVIATDPTTGQDVTVNDLTGQTTDLSTAPVTTDAAANVTGGIDQDTGTDAALTDLGLSGTTTTTSTDVAANVVVGTDSSTGADVTLSDLGLSTPATATATGSAATTAGTTATTTGAAPTAKQNTATVVSVDPTDNTALVVDSNGNTSVVNTDSTAKAGDTINLGGDTAGTTATGVAGASTATTSGGTASTAPTTPVQGTTAPTGTSVTANTGNVLSVDPTDNTALVVDNAGNTSVVNTGGTAKVGDTINLGGTGTTTTSNVAAQTGASTTGTSNTATVLSVDPNAGTALVKDSSGSVSVVNADAKTTVGDVVSLPTTKPVTTSVAVPARPAEIALDPNKTSISQLNQYIDQSLASGKSFDQVADAMKSAGYSDAYIQQKRQDAKDGTAADDDYVQLLKQIESQKQGAEQASMEQSRQQAATIAAQKQATQKSFESALQQGLALPSNFDSLNQPEQVQWFNMRGLTPSDLKSMGIVGDEAGLSIAELRNAGYSVVDPGLSAARKNELQKLDAIFKEDDPIGIANVANLYNITPNEIQNVFGYSDRQLRQLQNAGYAVQAAPVASVSPEQTSGTPTTGTVLSVDPTDNTALVVDPNGEIQVANVAPGTQPNSQVALEVAPTTPAQTAPEVVADVKPEVKPETKPEVVQQVAQETPADTALEADVLPPVTEQELASIVAGPVETAPEIVPEPASKPVTEVAPEVTPEVVPEVAQETVTDVVPEVKPEVKPEVVTEPTVTPEAKPDVEATTVKPEVSPEQTPVSPEPSPKVPVTPEPPSVAEDVLPPVTEDELRDIVAGTPSEPPAPPPPVTPPPVAPPSQPPAVQPPAQPPVVYPPEVAQFAKSLGIPQEMAAQMLQESSEADLLTMFAELFEEREQKRKERGAQSKSRKA